MVAFGSGGRGGFLVYVRGAGQRAKRRILSRGLIIAAAVYVVSAVARGDAAWVALELTGVAVYGSFVSLGLRFSPGWLAAGWAAHAAWDVGLHLVGPGVAVAPEWYAVACVSFDLVVASYILPAGPSEPSDGYGRASEKRRATAIRCRLMAEIAALHRTRRDEREIEPNKIEGGRG